MKAKKYDVFAKVRFSVKASSEENAELIARRELEKLLTIEAGYVVRKVRVEEQA